MLDRIAQLCQPFPTASFHRTESEDRRFADYFIALHRWQQKNVPVAILGVPCDLGVRRNGGRPGAAAAPAAIYTALARLAASSGSVSLPPDVAILDCGMLRTEGLTLEEIQQHQQQIVTLLLDSGATVIVLGGGHECALPNGRALAQHTRKRGIVNVDAHLDVRPPTAEGSHSGSSFRELLEDSHTAPSVFVELGIQPFSASAHHVRFVIERGHTIWMLPDIRRRGLEHALVQLCNQLGQCDGVHLSLDIDAVASAFAPGVSAPATDGFHPAEVATIIEHIAALPQCRLIDVVEVNPTFDLDSRTVRLAAWLVAHVLWTVTHRATANAPTSLDFRTASNRQ